MLQGCDAFGELLQVADMIDILVGEDDAGQPVLFQPAG